jgi:hypothetical protein
MRIYMQSTIYCHESLDTTFFEKCAGLGLPVKPYDASRLFSDDDYFVCSEKLLLTESSLLQTGNIRAEHILVVAERSVAAERAMLDKGLALLLTHDQFIKHAALLAQKRDIQNGSLLCIGTGQSDTQLIRCIGNLFGYETVHSSNLEESLAAVNENITLVIHDLSCRQIDLFQFVKRMSHSALKSLPYIACKSSGARIDVSDIQSGIKSFTRMILSPDEVYALLAVNLFKKEYYPLMSRLASRQDSDLELFGVESIKKIYFAHNDSFFSEHHESVCASVDDSRMACGEIESLIARFECIRWLVEKKDTAPRIHDASSMMLK